MRPTDPAGEGLRETLGELCTVPTVSLATRTREAEARAIVATVDRLVERGVSRSDMTIVVRDVDAYEAPLQRASRRYGLTLSIWTQIRLKRTIPYRLAVAVVSLLAAREQTGGGAIASEIILDPLRYEWVPPSDTKWSGDETSSPESCAAVSGDTVDSANWPFEPPVVDALARAVAGENHTVSGWGDRFEQVEARTKPDLTSYVDWVSTLPATPSPPDIPAMLGPLLDAYRQVVMPHRQASDDPTLTGTATSARSLARMEELTIELAEKYDSWLADGYGERSWTTVAELLDAIASTVPGRREYATARSVDVMEANDVWGLDLPYVIAAGLVDGEWPRPPESTYPAALRERLRANQGLATALRPRSGWTEAGELDQFADAVVAASEGLVCTRFTRDSDGVETRPSPYLRALDPQPVDASAVERLVGDPGELPPEIVAMVESATAPMGVESRTGDPDGGEE